jgi:hypothetical protein
MQHVLQGTLSQLGRVRLLNTDQGYGRRAPSLSLDADLTRGFQFFQRPAFRLRANPTISL